MCDKLFVFAIFPLSFPLNFATFLSLSFECYFFIYVLPFFIQKLFSSFLQRNVATESPHIIQQSLFLFDCKWKPLQKPI
jgi:hypothetical protein